MQGQRRRTGAIAGAARSARLASAAAPPPRDHGPGGGELVAGGGELVAGGDRHLHRDRGGGGPVAERQLEVGGEGHGGGELEVLAGSPRRRRCGPSRSRTATPSGRCHESAHRARARPRYGSDEPRYELASGGSLGRAYQAFTLTCVRCSTW